MQCLNGCSIHPVVSRCWLPGESRQLILYTLLVRSDTGVMGADFPIIVINRLLIVLIYPADLPIVIVDDLLIVLIYFVVIVVNSSLLFLLCLTHHLIDLRWGFRHLFTSRNTLNNKLPHLVVFMEDYTSFIP